MAHKQAQISQRVSKSTLVWKTPRFSLCRALPRVKYSHTPGTFSHCTKRSFGTPCSLFAGVKTNRGCWRLTTRAVAAPAPCPCSSSALRWISQGWGQAAQGEDQEMAGDIQVSPWSPQDTAVNFALHPLPVQVGRGTVHRPAAPRRLRLPELW